VLSEDLISIITVFVARYRGRRVAERKEKKTRRSHGRRSSGKGIQKNENRRRVRGGRKQHQRSQSRSVYILIASKRKTH
jgi:hypothetical protein